MSHKTALDAKVAAVNNANSYALALYPVMAEFFKSYIGQKIEKADGTLFKKIVDAMPKLPETDLPTYRLHVYRHTSNYSLAWCVKACESSPGLYHASCQNAHYHETVVYVGHMRNGVLHSFYDPHERRTDYTAEAVEAARETYKKAKAAADAAQTALFPFGEHDY